VGPTGPTGSNGIGVTGPEGPAGPGTGPTGPTGPGGGGGPSSPVVISPSTPLIVGSNLNDWAPTGLEGADVIRMTSAAAINLTGLLAILSTDQTLKKLYNIGTFTITVTNQDPLSASANRFLIPAGVSIPMAPNDVIDLFYDVATGAWRVG
jgi:hypothetical protein